MASDPNAMNRDPEEVVLLAVLERTIAELRTGMAKVRADLAHLDELAGLMQEVPTWLSHPESFYRNPGETNAAGLLRTIHDKAWLGHWGPWFDHVVETFG